MSNKKTSMKKIENLYLEAKNNFPNEWLILYEILELSSEMKSVYWIKEIKNKLNKLVNKNDDLGHAIKRGIDLI